MHGAPDPVAVRQAIRHRFPHLDVKSVLRKPLIVVSAPRSGSTLLYEQLALQSGFWTVGGESHGVFRAFPKLIAENEHLDSGALNESHADTETCDLLRHCFVSLLRNNRGEPYLMTSQDSRPPHVCLLEKTPRNALNIPFLRVVFPEARFVFLYREPRQTLASLIEAWTVGLQSGRFQTFRNLPDWDRPGWCFLLPPGWRALRGKSLAEIAAFQWQMSNEQILRDLRQLPAERSCVVDYQSLLDDPPEHLRRICDFANQAADRLPASGEVMPLSRTTISPPNAEKWKRHEREISEVLPPLLATIQKLERFRDSKFRLGT